ncbi:hypothetical protein [Nonomuraea sp. NPDC049480]|uniref:hypothetical protein n=1 Tax=Nonomuraea sp. NPDC049480 TaxID=3364353 RepID=UPI0037AA207A
MMRKFPQAVITGAIVAGLFAPAAAQAATPASTATSAVEVTSAVQAAEASAARWFTLWSGSKKGKYMYTPSQKNKARVLQAVVQCWSGGDGTRATVAFERRRYGAFYGASKPRTFACDGGKKYYRVNQAGVGLRYRTAIFLKGKSHTMRVWMQNYG